MAVRRMAIKRQAEDAIQPMLQPGERILAGSAVACGPSRSSGAWVPALGLALVAEALVGIFGPQPSLLSVGLLAAIGAGFPILAVHFAYRPMYIAVSDQRLIGLRLSRLGGAPGRLAFAAPLTDVRIRGHRSGRSRSSVRCEIRGRTRTRHRRRIYKASRSLADITGQGSLPRAGQGPVSCQRRRPGGHEGTGGGRPGGRHPVSTVDAELEIAETPVLSPGLELTEAREGRVGDITVRIEAIWVSGQVPRGRVALLRKRYPSVLGLRQQAGAAQAAPPEQAGLLPAPAVPGGPPGRPPVSVLAPGQSLVHSPGQHPRHPHPAAVLGTSARPDPGGTHLVAVSDDGVPAGRADSSPTFPDLAGLA